MIEIVLTILGILIALFSYLAVFFMGYHAASRQIVGAAEREQNGETVGGIYSNKLTYSWDLSAKEIEEIDDWEEFEEKAEE